MKIRIDLVSADGSGVCGRRLPPWRYRRGARLLFLPHSLRSPGENLTFGLARSGNGVVLDITFSLEALPWRPNDGFRWCACLVWWYLGL